MKKITEEIIFDLLDGKLSEAEQSEVLRKLKESPELEELYRSLLMTEGYIQSNAVEKPSQDFTDRVAGKVQRMVNQEKRNGILYRALSLVGIVTLLSIAGAVALAGDASAQPGSITDSGVFVDLLNQVSETMGFLSTGILKNTFMVTTAFTFFVFLDRVLMRRFAQ